MNWITILTALLPLLLQLLQLLFPPKPAALGPVKKKLLALACGRMQAVIDRAATLGVTTTEIGEAQAEDGELGAVIG